MKQTFRLASVVALLMFTSSAIAQGVMREFQATWDSVSNVTDYCLYHDTSPDMASRYDIRDQMDKLCTGDTSTALNWTLSVNDSGPNIGNDYFAVTASECCRGECVFKRGRCFHRSHSFASNQSRCSGHCYPSSAECTDRCSCGLGGTTPAARMIR